MIDWKETIRLRLASLKLDPAREAEIVEELAEHLEDRYAELLDSGASAKEAHLAALAELSEHELLAQELRRVEHSVNPDPVVLGARNGILVVDLWQDLRFGIRMPEKNAGLTAVVVLTLALGIGVNTALFTMLGATYFPARRAATLDPMVALRYD